MTEKELYEKTINIVGKDVFDKIFEKCRKREVVYLRVIFTKFYRECGLLICDVGEKLNTDHATIGHYIKMYDINYEYSKDFRNLADGILKE